MADSVGSTAGTPEPTRDEAARADNERDRLQAEAGEPDAQVVTAAPRRAGRPRRLAAALLVALTAVVFTVAVVGVWARRNTLDTDKWVETVEPLGADRRCSRRSGTGWPPSSWG